MKSFWRFLNGFVILVFWNRKWFEEHIKFVDSVVKQSPDLAEFKKVLRSSTKKM